MSRIRNVVRRQATSFLFWLLPLTLLLSPITPVAQASAAYSDPVSGDDSGAAVFTIAVQTSPQADYATSQTWTRSDWQRAWKAAKHQPSADALVYTDAFVEIVDSGVRKRYAMREDGVLSDIDTHECVKLPAKMRKAWVRAAKQLRSQHYGELLEWEEAKTRYPLKTVLTVRDLETGLQFQAQRRAGSHHADVQPLTREDTAIMKRIYGGEWSWKRRAIVVTAEGAPVAASMHGMPHGGDGIPDNEFSGHFCIHFLGSSTHRSGQVDLAHQLMVQKAAGRLSSLVAQYPLADRALALFESIRQHDSGLLRSLTDGSPMALHEQLAHMINDVDDVRAKLLRPSDQAAESASVQAELPVVVTIRGKGGGASEETYRLRFNRESVDAPWVLAEMRIGK
ncbi:MAG: hypothetical protein K0Q59_1048 [Paenibacillus sp.]|jgi:hypothetical protein|nr:hypothetical protein [Paenibacillus sp.]